MSYAILMAVMVPMPREKWTDERLDDLNKKVDDGFAQVHQDLREVNARFDAMNESVNARFDALNARFDSLNRNLFAGTVVIIAAMIGSNAL
jgi:tetrahydromethanopterin S-methyltransferase subunit G